jgi:hypothetical protein
MNSECNPGFKFEISGEKFTTAVELPLTIVPFLYPGSLSQKYSTVN